MKTVPKARVSQVYPLAAPIGGIDDTSSLANMDPMYAIDLRNYFPESGALKVRWGYQEHVTGMAANGKTLMVFNKQDGTSKLFCCTDVGIYDVTTSSAAPTNVKALTNGNVIWTQFSNIAGQWLIGCNGVDPAFIYDGTTWTNFANVAVPANPGEITTGGIAVADIVFVHAHKNRIWFLEKNTMSAWYWPLNAVSGASTEFPLGGVFSKGGSLSALFSLTMDSGVGTDDVLVYQSSKGEIGGYGGTDPNSSTDWGLIARYFIGSPLGRKTNIQLSGDVLLLTEYGLVSLLGVVNGQYQLGAKEATASSKISRTINNIVAATSGAPGWEMFNSPVFQYVIINIPTYSGVPTQQLIMNSVTGAWTKFDLPAITMYEYGQNVYFTDTTGKVMKYGSTTLDNKLRDGTGGSQIVAGVHQAYSFFEDQTRNKHFKFVKPIFESSYVPGLSVTISTDYAPTTLDDVGTPTSQSGGLSLWDVDEWDEASWSSPLSDWQTLKGVFGIGYSASLIMKIRVAFETRFVATHWVFEPGNSL